ncbi:MAG: DUF4268 domain-containing protein [Candidatus Poribacteria bacterium]|nr:DUF4268 domain-containing protein [Candidatus Poribacteria bacterium]
MLFSRRRIENDDELYQRYWSEFIEYYIADGLSLSSVGVSDRKQSYHFEMDSFAPFHIDLGVFLLGDSEISANINFNKQIEQNRGIFEALRSAQDIFQTDFDEELLFLPDRPRIYIIGCKTRADQRDPNDWSNQFEWLCTNIERLHKAFLVPLRITQYYEQTQMPQ